MALAKQHCVDVAQARADGARLQAISPTVPFNIFAQETEMKNSETVSLDTAQEAAKPGQEGFRPDVKQAKGAKNLHPESATEKARNTMRAMNAELKESAVSDSKLRGVGHSPAVEKAHGDVTLPEDCAEPSTIDLSSPGEQVPSPRATFRVAGPPLDHRGTAAQ